MLDGEAESQAIQITWSDGILIGSTLAGNEKLRAPLAHMPKKAADLQQAVSSVPGMCIASVRLFEGARQLANSDRLRNLEQIIAKVIFRKSKSTRPSVAGARRRISAVKTTRKKPA